MAEIALLPHASYRAISLEEMVAEAQELGKVEMSQAWVHPAWRVEITFSNRRGSRICARADHGSLPVALGNCINEARELGAGVPG